MFRRKTVPSIFLFIFLFLSGRAFAQDPVRVIVEFNGARDASLVASHGGTVLGFLSSSNSIVANVPGNALAALLGNANIASIHEDAAVTIEPVRIAAGRPAPPPPAEEMPWGINRIDADLAWAATRGAGVVVAVVDTGILASHSDLAPRVVLGPNYVNTIKTSVDDNGHGTHVAGTIGASDNDIGVVGVAPLSTLVAVKVLDKNGSGFLSNVVKGIDWAAANGAKVINLSLGSTSDVPAMKASVDAAAAAGVVVCAAAGNSGDGNPATPDPASYPGAYDSVLGVAATDSSDQIAYFSTNGAYVDIAGPGVSVKSTWKDGGYRTINGTSMATPHVAGTAALAVAAGVANVRSALLSTADDLGVAGLDPQFGSGLVDAQEAVTGIQTLP